MTTGVTIDGFTIEEIQEIIQSIDTDDDTGAQTGGYGGENLGIAANEDDINAKTGAITGFYMPEIAALFSTEL